MCLKTLEIPPFLSYLHFGFSLLLHFHLDCKPFNHLLDAAMKDSAHPKTCHLLLRDCLQSSPRVFQTLLQAVSQLIGQLTRVTESERRIQQLLSVFVCPLKIKYWVLFLVEKRPWVSKSQSV